MITRRQFFTFFGGTVAGATALGGYAFGYNPMRTPRITHYAPTPENWPSGLNLRIAVIADVHACDPWMSADRIAQIAEATNALEPDMIVLLGDYVAGHALVRRQVPWQAWGDALATLNAPLGVHAILGNHDWWKDADAMARKSGPTFSHLAMERAGISLHENDAVKLEKDGQGFWLAGLGDQLAFLPAYGWDRTASVGLDDLPGTLAKVTDDDPVICLPMNQISFRKFQTAWRLRSAAIRMADKYACLAIPLLCPHTMATGSPMGMSWKRTAT